MFFNRKSEKEKTPKFEELSSESYTSNLPNLEEVYQVLKQNYGHILTEEIFENLDYQFAMRLADNDDDYNRSLSVAEKMQILYSHQMLLKK